MTDFDETIDRRNTHSAKWDAMETLYGVSPDDGISMWVADMDFHPPQAVTAAVQGMVDHGVYGYYGMDASYKAAICGWMDRRHGWKVDPDWIFSTHGLVNGTALCIQAFTEKGDGVILFRGIASWLRPLTLWHVHRFGIVINNSGIGRWDFALLNGDTQDARKDGLGGRGQPKLLVALDAIVPLGNQSPAANDGDAVAALPNVVIKPAFGAVELLRVYAHLPGRYTRPFDTRIYSSGHKGFSPLPHWP